MALRSTSTRIPLSIETLLAVSIEFYRTRERVITLRIVPIVMMQSQLPSSKSE